MTNDIEIIEQYLEKHPKIRQFEVYNLENAFGFDKMIELLKEAIKKDKKVVLYYGKGLDNALYKFE